MLTYPSDHRGYPPQHVAVPPFSTAAAPFTVDGVHPVDQTFPNPSLDAPAITSLYAAGEWGNAPWMEAPVRYMAPDAAASASPGFSGHYHLNKDPSGPARSPIGGASSFPIKSLTSENILGNISRQAAEAEESAHTQILTKEGQEHSHCHPDVEENLLQMSDSSSRNQATFLKLIHNLSVVLLSTCNGGSSLQEYEEEILKSVIRNLKAASSKGGKATLKGDDCLRDSSQISCLRNNLLVAIPEHSVSESTDSEFKASISQALSKLPEENMLDDTEVSQMSIYKKLWFEAEASVCKLKYELQRARMKLATTKVLSNTQTVPIDPSESDKASRVTVSDGQPHNHAKDCSLCAATLQCHGGGSDGRQSSSVINRVTTQQNTCVLAAQVPAASPVPPPPALVPQPLGDNKCEEQEKGSEGSYPVEDAVLARLQILKSRADNITSLGLESSKQQLNARTGVAYEVEDAIMARLGSLKSHPDVEASSIGVVEGVEEDPCAVGLRISGHRPLPSPPALFEKTTLLSEVSGEFPAILISSSDKAPALCMLKDAPSVMEKDHSGLADDALHSVPLLSVPQEAGGLAQKTAKDKRHPHGPMPRRFRLPSTVKIKCPISEQRALAILLRRLGMIKKDEVDERAMDRCLAVLGASFPKSLLQAIFCDSNMVKGTPGELWGISAGDVIF